jgi:hypothetical protein
MIWQMALADFRERSRRYSFLATLTFVFFFGLLVITGKFGVYPGRCRGDNNSAWIGATMAISGAAMAILVGFYLVKNTIKRDRITGVGEILAASSLRNTAYIGAKFLSNIMTLLAMTGILVVSAVLMQALTTGISTIEPWKLIAPFLLITIPTITVIAALAILFESVRPLSGALGNVVYFFLLSAMLNPFALDLNGFLLIINDMQKTVHAAFPDRGNDWATGFIGFSGVDVSSFPVIHWEGMHWTLSMILSRLAFVGSAIVITFVAVPFFDRFDISRRSLKIKLALDAPDESTAAHRPTPALSVSSLRAVVPRFTFLDQVVAEFSLLLRRVSWRWRIIALALIVLQFVLPFNIVRMYIVPASWLWPILLWSSMGGRERTHATEALLFSSAHPISRQLSASWVAGILLAIVTVAGAFGRAGFATDLPYISTLVIASLLIPTLALALGVLSGGCQLFEVVYLFLWYVGPINHVPGMDFLGTVQGVDSWSLNAVYFEVTLIMLSTAFVVRRRQLIT